MGNLHYSPWIYNFLLKLLEGDEDTINLLAEDPFHDSDVPPQYIRIDGYRYSFQKAGGNSRECVSYWKREYQGPVFPTQGVADKKLLSEIVQTQSKL